MMPETLTPVRRGGRAGRQAVVAAAVILVGVSGVVVVSRSLGGPAVVDRITIVNATEFDVDVDVSGDDGRLLELRYVAAGKKAVVRDVIDQGAVWVFHFSFGGTDAGTLRLDRTRLVQDDWTVEIPQEVADRLDDAGHRPPPR
jgi:hypothetical protein